MAGAPPYTRIDIITEALSQIGRTDLTANGRKWLNLFLDKVYRQWDWNFLLRDSGYVSLVDGGSFPSGYRAMKTATLYYQQNGVYTPQRELASMTADEWMARKRIGTIANSQPRNFFINWDTQTFQFWPPPDLPYVWQYFYYYVPTIPTDADNTHDTDAPLWPFAQELLIRAVQLKGLYYKDDERYQAEIKDVMQELERVRFNAIDTRAGNNRLKLGKNFRRRY